MTKLKTFVRYDVKGRIIPGSAILSKEIPKNGFWEEINFDIDYGNSELYNNLKAYIGYTKKNEFIPSSNILINKVPRTGKWKQINVKFNLNPNPSPPPEIPDGAITTMNGAMIVLSSDGDYVLTVNGFVPINALTMPN